MTGPTAYDAGHRLRRPFGHPPRKTQAEGIGQSFALRPGAAVA